MSFSRQGHNWDTSHISRKEVDRNNKSNHQYIGQDCQLAISLPDPENGKVIQVSLSQSSVKWPASFQASILNSFSYIWVVQYQLPSLCLGKLQGQTEGIFKKQLHLIHCVLSAWGLSRKGTTCALRRGLLSVVVFCSWFLGEKVSSWDGEHKGTGFWGLVALMSEGLLCQEQASGGEFNMLLGGGSVNLPQ